MSDEPEIPSEKIRRLEEELALLKATQYVTHETCGAILETGRNTWADDGSVGDLAIYVICPVCQDIVDEGELSNGNNHYLVRKPE